MTNIPTPKAVQYPSEKQNKFLRAFFLRSSKTGQKIHCIKYKSSQEQAQNEVPECPSNLELCSKLCHAIAVLQTPSLLVDWIPIL